MVDALSAASYEVCSPLLRNWSPVLQGNFTRSHFYNVSGGWFWWAERERWFDNWLACDQMRDVNLANDCPPPDLP